MELYNVMSTTFASRDFTDEPLPDETLFKILDHTRFAPSGGNRQAERYAAQVQGGETPWNTIERTRGDAGTIERTPAPRSATEPVLSA